MLYEKKIILKNGKELLMRNGTELDAEAVFNNFNQTHAETDFLMTYPEENSLSIEAEAEFLKNKAESSNEIEIIALIDNRVVGSAGIEAVGNKYKVKHRAEFGISILKEYWGLGIGTLLTNACIECAKAADYKQLELDVVSENSRAIALYKSLGFTEYGRNPLGFNSKLSGYQTVVLMRLEINK